MTNCSVPGCCSESFQGFGVFNLPRNAETCSKWLQFLQNCGKSTSPLKNFRICELHFDSSDIIRGNSRKLIKPGAVPLFRDNQAIASSTVGNAQEYEDFEELTDDFDVQELQESLDNKLVQEQENYDEMIIEDIVCEESSKSLAVLDSLFARITQLEKDLRDEKKNSKRLAIKNSFVKKELNDMKKGLKKYFGDDQIQALTKKKIKNWSNATVKKAMIIKKKGGKSFLDFVRNNVAPLPATRILQSRQNLWDASSRQSIKSEKVLISSSSEENKISNESETNENSKVLEEKINEHVIEENKLHSILSLCQSCLLTKKIGSHRVMKIHKQVFKELIKFELCSGILCSRCFVLLNHFIKFRQAVTTRHENVLAMRQQKAEKKLVTTIQLPELIIKEEPIYEDEEYLDQIHEPEAKNEVQATENLNKVSFPHEELLLKIVPQTDTQSPLKTTKMIYRKFYLPQPSNLKISRVQSILTKPMTNDYLKWCRERVASKRTSCKNVSVEEPNSSAKKKH